MSIITLTFEHTASYNSLNKYQQFKMNDVSFYFLSDEGSERDKRISGRFSLLNIPAKRVQCVSPKWLEEKGYQNYGCSWGHIKMIKEFVENSDKEFGMFFEDDVYLAKSLPHDISFLCNRMKMLELDVLLTGYLIDYLPYLIGYGSDYEKLGDVGFYTYPHNLWGSQSYILTRKNAISLFEKYNEDYLIRSMHDSTLKPFSIDWTITKDGKRAMVYPMYAVEEGNINTTDEWQIKYHRDCFEFNYKENQYV